MSRLSFISNSELAAPAQTMRKRRQSRAHSRLTCIWLLIIWIIVNVIASFVIDYCPQDVRFPEMQWALKRLDRAHGAPIVVCYGSSRFAKAVRPDRMTQLVQTS